MTEKPDDSIGWADGERTRDREAHGHVADGDTVATYYGTSDEMICGARLSIAALPAALA